MRLVEVVAGDETAEEALAAATEAAAAMGREPVRAADGIGFVANRCAAPVHAGGAAPARATGSPTHEQIDRIVRLGGGFRMGPFELMDLVGIDVNFEVAQSFWEQSFHEPRWQPHPIQARMVAAGPPRPQGGRGCYDYGDGPHRPDDPEPPRARAATPASRTPSSRRRVCGLRVEAAASRARPGRGRGRLRRPPGPRRRDSSS